MDKMDAQDKALSDALSVMVGESATEAVNAPERGVNARRTAIAQAVHAPVTGYAVEIAGHVVEVEAPNHGEAVLRARDELRGTVKNVGGYVFMWRFTVTDSTGLSFDGGDRYVRESVEAARIARVG